MAISIVTTNQAGRVATEEKKIETKIFFYFTGAVMCGPEKIFKTKTILDRAICGFNIRMPAPFSRRASI